MRVKFGQILVAIACLMLLQGRGAQVFAAPSPGLYLAADAVASGQVNPQYLAYLASGRVYDYNPLLALTQFNDRNLDASALLKRALLIAATQAQQSQSPVRQPGDMIGRDGRPQYFTEQTTPSAGVVGEASKQVWLSQPNGKQWDSTYGKFSVQVNSDPAYPLENTPIKAIVSVQVRDPNYIIDRVVFNNRQVNPGQWFVVEQAPKAGDYLEKNVILVTAINKYDRSKQYYWMAYFNYRVNGYGSFDSDKTNVTANSTLNDRQCVGPGCLTPSMASFKAQGDALKAESDRKIAALKAQAQGQMAANRPESLNGRPDMQSFKDQMEQQRQEIAQKQAQMDSMNPVTMFYKTPKLNSLGDINEQTAGLRGARGVMGALFSALGAALGIVAIGGLAAIATPAALGAIAIGGVAYLAGSLIFGDLSLGDLGAYWKNAGLLNSYVLSENFGSLVFDAAMGAVGGAALTGFLGRALPALARLGGRPLLPASAVAGEAAFGGVSAATRLGVAGTEAAAGAETGVAVRGISRIARTGTAEAATVGESATLSTYERGVQESIKRLDANRAAAAVKTAEKSKPRGYYRRTKPKEEPTAPPVAPSQPLTNLPVKTITVGANIGSAKVTQ